MTILARSNPAWRRISSRSICTSLPYAGALHDPVAALLLCTSVNVSLSVINGKVVVRDGKLTTLELEPLIERHNTIARALANGEDY